MISISKRERFCDPDSNERSLAHDRNGDLQQEVLIQTPVLKRTEGKKRGPLFHVYFLSSLILNIALLIILSFAASRKNADEVPSLSKYGMQ